MFGNDNVIFQFTGPMGVRVDVGQSMVMLIGVLAFLSGSIVDGAIFAALLVAAIFLHELGHAWGCLVQGVPVRRIMLHGGGGFCEHARSPSARESELIIAMGPLVNLGLWAAVGLLQWSTLDITPETTPNWFLTVRYYLNIFGFLNLALFFFNMLPVQPLDGGRLLHLGLLRLFAPTTAHRATGWVGLVFSILWIPAAVAAFVFSGWILFFIPSIPAHYRMARGQLS